MRARTGVALGVLVIGAVLAGYVWFTWGEVQENRYTSYAEARASRQRDRLPAMLPASATEIHEWHDLGTHLRLGSFRFDPSERSHIAAALRAGSRRAIRIDRDPSFATPAPLPRDPDAQKLASAGFELYSGPDFDWAINWKAGVAYYWSASHR